MNKSLAIIALAAIAGAAISQPSLSQPIVQGSGIVQNADEETGAFRIDIRRGPIAPNVFGVRGSFRFARFGPAANAPSLQLETNVKSAQIVGNQANFSGPTRVIIRSNSGAPIFAVGLLQGVAVDNRAPTAASGNPDTLSFVFTGASLVGPISFSGEVIAGDIRVRPTSPSSPPLR